MNYTELRQLRALLMVRRHLSGHHLDGKFRLFPRLHMATAAGRCKLGNRSVHSPVCRAQASPVQRQRLGRHHQLQECLFLLHAHVLQCGVAVQFGATGLHGVHRPRQDAAHSERLQLDTRVRGDAPRDANRPATVPRLSARPVPTLSTRGELLCQRDHSRYRCESRHCRYTGPKRKYDQTIFIKTHGHFCYSTTLQRRREPARAARMDSKR